MEISILEKHMNRTIEKTLLELGLTISGVGLGSVEFSTTSKKVFNKAKEYLMASDIKATL